jgi:hypothetical protein
MELADRRFHSCFHLFRDRSVRIRHSGYLGPEILLLPAEIRNEGTDVLKSLFGMTPGHFLTIMDLPPDPL